MPVGAHMLLSFLAEPLKQPNDTLPSFHDNDVFEDLHEFEDWVNFLTLLFYSFFRFFVKCFVDYQEFNFSFFMDLLILFYGK